MTLVESHGLANRPGKPYPATFRIASVERRGIEPRLPGCKPGVFPLDQRPINVVRAYFCFAFGLSGFMSVAVFPRN